MIIHIYTHTERDTEREREKEREREREMRRKGVTLHKTIFLTPMSLLLMCTLSAHEVSCYPSYKLNQRDEFYMTLNRCLMTVRPLRDEAHRGLIYCQ